MYKCRQCHYWNKINGQYKCNAINGRTGHTDGSEEVCGNFDYWRNHEMYIDPKTYAEFVVVSGEAVILDDGQLMMDLEG